MFFLLSKVAWFLLQPLVAVLLTFGAGFLGFLFKAPRLGLALFGLATLVLAVVSLSPLGLLMMSVLENRFSKPELPPKIAGIVVLGGAFDTVIARTRDVPELNEAADRVTAAVALARRYPDAKVLFSGGSAAVFGDIAETIPAHELFRALGLPEERLILEDRSRNTVENAVFSRELAQPKPGEVWLLVTSAYHMPRAAGCFRKAGFDVLPYPVDYQTPAGGAVWQPSTTTVRNLEKVHFAIREYVGLLAYRLAGNTDALFPAP